MPEVEPVPDNAPEHAFIVGGRRYLVNCYNGGLRYNQDRCGAIAERGNDHAGGSGSTLSEAELAAVRNVGGSGSIVAWGCN